MRHAGNGVRAVERVIQAAPARVSGVEQEPRVEDRYNQLRASDPRDFIVDIPGSDRKRRGFGSQIADGAKERLIFLHVEGLALTRKMPVIDLLLHLIADRQQLAIAWCQVRSDEHTPELQS